MTKNEALKMAMEAFDAFSNDDISSAKFMEIQHKAIQACKEALEQPAQEPVAEVDFRLEYDCGLIVDRSKVHNGQKLYTHPAPSWQGLSDDDMEKAKFYDESFYNGARWAEQALKEKNHV